MLQENDVRHLPRWRVCARPATPPARITGSVCLEDHSLDVLDDESGLPSTPLRDHQLSRPLSRSPNRLHVNSASGHCPGIRPVVSSRVQALPARTRAITAKESRDEEHDDGVRFFEISGAQALVESSGEQLLGSSAHVSWIQAKVSAGPQSWR
jgi:hypothetical protein